MPIRYITWNQITFLAKAFKTYQLIYLRVECHVPSMGNRASQDQHPLHTLAALWPISYNHIHHSLVHPRFSIYIYWMSWIIECTLCLARWRELRENQKADKIEPLFSPLITPPQVKILVLEKTVIFVGFLSLSLALHYRCGLSLNRMRKKST